jgi:hypothetical protein
LTNFVKDWKKWQAELVIVPPPLMFEAAFKHLDSIANNLVEEACNTSAAG